MRITSIAYGTRGDVEPALALADELQARGHKVRTVVAADSAKLVEERGLEAAPAELNIKELLHTAGGLDLMESGQRVGVRRSFKSMRRLFDEHSPGIMEHAYHASRDADVVLSGFLSNVFATSICEKLGNRQISVMAAPIVLATRSGPATLSAPRPGGASIANLLLYKTVLERVDWGLTQGPANRFRTALGLPVQDRTAYYKQLRQTPILRGVSPHVVPHPSDWPATVHTTGYWLKPVEPDWTAPERLLEFLDAGDPPVLISFGSMTARDPRYTTKLLADAVIRSGRRAVLQTGWAGLGTSSMPKEIYVLGAAPHSWLLPRVSAMVHHGGAGTTGQAMSASVPAVAVPHAGDQPYWGARIARLGVGPSPIPRAKLTARRLAAAIVELTTNAEMRHRAAVLGERIRREDGVGTAATLIEHYAGGR